jgi:hypothetical protein
MLCFPGTPIPGITTGFQENKNEGKGKLVKGASMMFEFFPVQTISRHIGRCPS